MRKIICIILLLSSITNCKSQIPDIKWLFAYNRLVTFDFETIPPTMSTRWCDCGFYTTHACYSDTLGDIRLFSNGWGIYDSSYHFMQGSDTLSLPLSLNYNELGGPAEQGAIIINKPNSIDTLLVFTTRINPRVILGDVVSDRISYSSISMTRGALPSVCFDFEHLLLQDTLDEKINIVRHSNGRDWWLLMFEHSRSQYYRYLITPTGIDSIGKSGYNIPKATGVGQGVFSPDGTKYAQADAIYVNDGWHLHIFDFDRCTGLLSNQVHIRSYNPRNVGAVGCAFSPNSRFLYVNAFDRVIQYDMLAADIRNSGDTIAVYDGFVSPFQTNFFMGMLAPNGKIYITSTNGVTTMHVIENPDLKGDSCGIVQHGLSLPTYNSASLPNFPHFRLGAMDGSSCDTLGIDHIQRPNLSVYPYKLDFGAVPTNRDSTMSLLCINTGFAPLEVTNITPDTLGEYQVISPTSFTLQPGDSTRVWVRYVPTNLSRDSVWLRFHHNGLLGQSVVGMDGRGDWGVAVDGANESSFRVYPNPARDILMVEVAQNQGSISVFDVLGRKVFEQDVAGSITQIHVSDWMNGLYLITLSGENGAISTKKIIIER